MKKKPSEILQNTTTIQIKEENKKIDKETRGIGSKGGRKEGSSGGQLRRERRNRGKDQQSTKEQEKTLK